MAISGVTFLAEGPNGPPTPSIGFSTGKDALSTELEGARDLNGVFRVVRRAVKKALRLERAGLSLALADMPPTVGAFWQLTGNVIVMNEVVLRGVEAIAASRAESNAFAFVVLAHEYLHSLGYWDEEDVRRVTHGVARSVFGSDHLVTKMAGGDLWDIYPFLRMLPRGDGDRMRFVSRFDRDVTDSYIR